MCVVQVLQQFGCLQLRSSNVADSERKCFRRSGGACIQVSEKRLPDLEKPNRSMRAGARDVSLLFTVYDPSPYRKHSLTLKRRKSSADAPAKVLDKRGLEVFDSTSSLPYMLRQYETGAIKPKVEGYRRTSFPS